MRNDQPGATTPQNAAQRKPDGKNGHFSRGRLAAMINRWKNRARLALGLALWCDVPPQTGNYFRVKQVARKNGRVGVGELVEIFVRHDGNVFVRKGVGLWVSVLKADRTGSVQYYGPVRENPNYFWGRD